MVQMPGCAVVSDVFLALSNFAFFAFLWATFARLTLNEFFLKLLMPSTKPGASSKNCGKSFGPFGSMGGNGVEVNR